MIRASGTAKQIAKPSLSAHKKALHAVHEQVGKLPKGQPGKFGSPQAGTSKKGYRLDPPHDNVAEGDAEKLYHFNWWTIPLVNAAMVVVVAQFQSKTKNIDQHKIENFVKAHPGVVFPAYQHLDGNQARAIQGLIAKSMGSPGLEGLALVRKLHDVGAEISDLQADEASFSVGKVLRRLRLICPENVYLNWHRFDNVDQISLVDLDQYFSDIWYPSSDDLDVFDESAKWILSITHYGKVRLFRI